MNQLVVFQGEVRTPLPPSRSASVAQLCIRREIVNIKLSVGSTKKTDKSVLDGKKSLTNFPNQKDPIKLKLNITIILLNNL